MKDISIRINKPIFGREEFDNLRDVLDSGQLVAGKYVKQFEREFAKFVGRKYCTLTCAGRHAFYLALEYCGIKPYTNWNSRIALVTHWFGIPEPIPEADIVLEDCCQAHGADNIGTHGNAAVFSFYPTKNMTAGGGGAVLTDGDPIEVEDGFDMVEIQAAIGVAQLKKLPKFVEIRRKNAKFYSDNGLGEFVKEASYNTYPIKDISGTHLVSALRERGIEAKRYKRGFVNIPCHPALQDADLQLIADTVKKELKRRS